MEDSEITEVNNYRSLLRLNSQIFGLSLGLLSAICIFAITNWMVFKKDPEMSAFLQLLDQFLPGYNVSLPGSIVGALYGFAIGTFMGSSIVRTYKLLLKSSIVQPNNIVVRLLFGKKVRSTGKKDFSINVYRANERLFGLNFGLAVGLTIFIATNWIVIKGGHVTSSGEHFVGPHLQLLNQFFIGYRVSFWGSIIGFAYGFAVGAFSGTMVGWIYNRMAGFRRWLKNRIVDFRKQKL